MPFRGRGRGSSLATTLLVSLVLVTLGFALAGVSVAHLHLENRASHEVEALNLARSAVARAVEKTFSASSFGAGRSDFLDFEMPETVAGARGRLTFRPGQARDWGVRYSTNNLAESVVAEGDGLTVPAFSLHLVGIGESGGVTRTVEAVLRYAMFPQAIVSSGPVRSQGGLTVAALARPGVLDESKLQPADLVSNASGDRAVWLAAGTRITGDVQAVGKVELPSDPSSYSIGGEVRPESSPVDIATLDPGRHDPTVLGIGFEELAQETYSEATTTLAGAARRDGSLIVTGDLVLDGALVYVTGDLTVQGHVTGRGILAVAGATTVGRGAEFTAGQKLALLSGGNVSLSGAGPDSSFLQGILYTRGSLRADRVTVVGAVVVDGDESEGVDLTDSRVLYDPEFEGVVLAEGTLPETIEVIPVLDDFYAVFLDPTADPPRLNIFRFEDRSLPDRGASGWREELAREVAGQQPDAFFEIPESMLSIPTRPPPPMHLYMGSQGAYPPETFAGLDAIWLDLVRDDLPELLKTEPYRSNNFTLEELTECFPRSSTDRAIMGVLQRPPPPSGPDEEGARVELRPSEVLKPNEHHRTVFWRES